MAIVKKISELTPKGSNLGTTDLLIVGVDNGTDYDLKSVTGAQLLGTVVSQTITNGVTTKSPSEDVVYDNLALKVDKVVGSRLITTAEGTILSNTSGINTGDQDISGKVDSNTAIIGATKTKITYDSKGLVTSGADATTSDIADSLNKRYVTDANLTTIGNTSGTNTGDETVTTIKTKLGITTLSGSNTGDQDLSTLLVKSNNLSDLTNTTTARSNLGLGTLATQSGTFSGTSSGTNTGDQIISDATITTTDITTNNFTTAKHGFVPKGTNTGKFLKDDGTWGTPASGGSGVCGIANSSGVYTYYATLSLAITAAVSGQTVDLLTNITETGSVTLLPTSGIRINGNGYTYTLSVNDDTNAISWNYYNIELYNIKVIRTGRTANSGGAVFSKNDTASTFTLKCQNVVFENTYGVGVSANKSIIFGLTINSYGDGVVSTYESIALNNCIITSTNAYGVNLPYSSYDIVNCNVVGSTYGILNGGGHVYNSIGKTSSGVGISATYGVTNSTGISSSGNGIATNNGNNCIGISTSAVGLSGTFKNSTGISTSGYAGTNGTKTNCTLISSSNYASFQENLNNCYLESTTNVPLWLSTSKLINSCTAICLWNNAGGHAINTTSASTGVEIRNCNLSVTNASAYCINGASASTFKYASNTFKGSTTAVNTTNVAQGITNTEDNQGNILI